MKNNYCIIMAGGVGSRFWPFSTNEKPKQFLDFFGTGRSLLRMTYERLDGIVPASNVFIVTNKIYKDTILEQLPELAENQVLLEPMRRNTAPCIAYAVYRIQKQNPKANIVVLPSDHLITNEKEFQRVITEGLRFVANNDALLTLGMKPTRPETGYGYIQFGNGGDELRKVKTFTEKPNLEMAKVFLSSGEFAWNSGMFLWRADVIINQFNQHLPEVADKFEQGIDAYATDNEQTFINRIYPECPNISIDYGIMEKAENVYVMLADFGWSDLGTWGSLHEITSKDSDNNAVAKCQTMFYNAQNNMVALPEGELVVIDGLDGYLVARDNGVLLICPKDQESKIRQYVKDAEEKFGNKYI
ncbi:MAG: mannose-1-phosphate guanylyltransferase [Paludibacteraceae bacterium]|jgi:mannose-1-phosphate guanylyltransferase|nr:mannose-1-phosphate guanylyltransferase [Paludibacteraceae bacterium]